MSESAQNSSESLPDTRLMLEEAQHLHQSGALEQAEIRYNQVLAIAPEDFVALHLLGVVKNQRGDFEAAEAVLTRALAINPRSALAHLNRGIALWNLNRHQEALAHYLHSLRFNPEDPDALLNCASALSRLQRHAEALTRLDKLLTLHPDSPEALLNRGIVLEALHRTEEALDSYDLALALKPDFPDALTNRGNALLALDHPEEALDSYERALAFQPDHAGARLNRDDPRLHAGIALNARMKEGHDKVFNENGSGGLALSEKKKVLLLLPEYVTGAEGECGEFPVEADLHYHFKKALLALDYLVIEPVWNIKQSRLTIDMESLSRLLDEHQFSCCIMEMNFSINETLASNVWFRNRELVEKLKAKAGGIVTFIGDSYPRGGIIEVIEDAYHISDIVWCPYQGVIGMLQMYNRVDLINKIHTSMILPTIFHNSRQTSFPENRAYEISYIGTAKRMRLNAVAEFCRLDNLNIFVNTTTRDFNSFNDSKSMNYYLDVLDNSVSTITSSARSPEPMETNFDVLRLKFPEVFSGRFVEAISRGCLPIYIAKDGQDYPPLPNLKEGVHYFRVELIHDYNTVLRALRGLDRRATIQALREYHAAYLSPAAALAPLLKRLERTVSPADN